MLPKPASDWLLPRGETDQNANKFLFDVLFSLRHPDVERLLSNIQEFEGTKVMVPCTDRTPLDEVLKLALCLADLVIVVPAPLWISCLSTDSTSYPEFNYECVGRGGWWFSSMNVLDKLSSAVKRIPELFQDGVVTFLPFLGQSMHRWSHPHLGLADLPHPYVDRPCSYTLLDLHLEGLFNLYSERLMSEALGAMHLNSASFANPVVGDFVVTRETRQEPSARRLMEIKIPPLARVSLPDVFRLRHELPEVFSQFSQDLVHTLQSGSASSGTADSDVEFLRWSARHFRTRLAQQLSDETSAIGPSGNTTVTLGLGEARSGLRESLESLKESRDLRAFKNLIIRGTDGRLETVKNSFLGAFELSGEN